MSDKLEKAVDAIIQKTEEGKIEWERTDAEMLRKNPFYYNYISNNDMAVDPVNNYVAPYKDGYIYFTNQVEDGYREIAIQPKVNADITVLSTGRSTKLRTLEEIIKNELDNPDDFIESLFDE
ncbi:MAG: hypothetical protein IJO65_13480 [Lachnospiraceae bacterium]|nr:hypothetical protein [Lachnospiraceae bacterium]